MKMLFFLWRESSKMFADMLVQSYNLTAGTTEQKFFNIEENKKNKSPKNNPQFADGSIEHKLAQIGIVINRSIARTTTHFGPQATN